MKKTAIFAVILAACFIFAGTGNATEWAMSTFGDKDGGGINAYPGSYFYWKAFASYPTDGLTDGWFCGFNENETECRTEWTQSGFPEFESLRAAQMTIVHGGFYYGEVYIQGPYKLRLIGTLTAGQNGSDNFVVEDNFDLTPYRKILMSGTVKLVLKIPKLAGYFATDNGFVDYVEIRVYGLKY